MWILLALLSAVLAATRRTNEKKLLQHFNHFTMGLIVQLLSLPVILIALIIKGDFLNPLSLGPHFWLPLLVVCVGFYPLNTLLGYQAIKHGELSKVLPIMSLWPVFSIIPAAIALGEFPSILAILGILLTVLGVYALGLKGAALHHPLQPFREDKNSRNMLFSVVLITLAGVLDKIAINASNAIFYSFISTIGAVFTLAVAVKISKVNEFTKLRKSLANLGAIGTLQGGSYTTYLMAIAAGPIAYVSAIRNSNILIGSLLGIVLLNEKFTLPKKISLVLILFGGSLLAVGS